VSASRDSTDSQDGEYVNEHSHSQQDEDEDGEDEDDEKNKLEQHEENGNLSSSWEAQKLIGYGLPESHPLILTITPGYTQSCEDESCHSQGAPVLVSISQNCLITRILRC